MVQYVILCGATKIRKGDFPAQRAQRAQRRFKIDIMIKIHIISHWNRVEMVAYVIMYMPIKFETENLKNVSLTGIINFLVQNLLCAGTR